MITGELGANAGPFTDTVRNISSRPRTAEVSWPGVPPWTRVGAAGPEQRTPDIGSIIEQIVQQAGWRQGNGLVIIIDGVPGSKRVAESYNGGAARAPLLYVEYSDCCA